MYRNIINKKEKNKVRSLASHRSIEEIREASFGSNDDDVFGRFDPAELHRTRHANTREPLEA